MVVATLWVSACGSNPNQPGESIPAFGFNWSGTYSTGTCVGPAILVDDVGGVFTNNVLPFTMNLTESGSSVSGTFALGTVAFPETQGTITAGSESLAPSSAQVLNGITLRVSWTLTTKGTDLSGPVVLVFSDSVGDTATVDGQIVTASH